MDTAKKTEQMFIRNDQYNFIAQQVYFIVHTQNTVNHQDTRDGVKLHAMAKVREMIPGMTENQEALLNRMTELENETEARTFLNELKRDCVIPFQALTKKKVEKLFPKAKKLQIPDLDALDFQRLSYLGWFDTRAHKQYLIVEYQGRLKGIAGHFANSNNKGICSICNHLGEVALFVTKVKSGKETYTSRGNYICKDSHVCNENLTDIKKLEVFLDHLFQ
ncbi:FusB/FusC family EF-G-binding protein [Jeotgalibacillus haloalkalitolerans]|uniref:FusB/FusC family EF-G-binding protein n=1 Tax=Jeotgalibacillus haloalkalitolerans TaxID=3104292 RepID=A0ABU5KNW3_9BACL|nr:FusB/FusC family EF-G-binding protein [Jeotgalibacillus sp. HH7-29]MDZ5712646.1 FusB/FusC family EF-G-binding protein [Jeotgalibacillus sp. HH7-29]